MPYPLKPGYNFDYNRTIRPPYYEMSTSEAYTDFYGISYMVSGERLIYSPNFTTIVQAGELTFIPKNVYRRTTYISNNPYERILIKFTDKMVQGVINTIGRKAYDELCTEHVIRFSDATRDKVLAILDEMEQEWNSYNEYSELLLTGLLNKLIITCHTERLVGGTNMMNIEKKNVYLGQAIKYIKAHLSTNPSLEDTADAINISASYLSKIFINHLHTPYSTFVLNERMTYARKLILNSELSMTDIAAECGFSSSAYFSDAFKKAMGVSPLQFRKQKG